MVLKQDASHDAPTVISTTLGGTVLQRTMAVKVVECMGWNVI